MNCRSIAIALAALSLFGAGTTIRAGERSAKQPLSLSESLTLSASFDNADNPDAEFARGDARLYIASTLKRTDAKAGLNSAVAIEKNGGKRGGALRFLKQTDAAVFFKANRNIDYRTGEFGATISFLLKFDPETDLAPGYTDPLQITDRGWNDGAIWVDLSKDDKPRHFRLGTFPNLSVWNPANTDFDTLTAAQKPMFDAGPAPFRGSEWTHVAITLEHINSGQNNGAATLYINGKRQGTVANRDQTMTWNLEQAAVLLGINYKGLFDELLIFDRPLSEAEIQEIGEKGSPLVVEKPRKTAN